LAKIFRGTKGDLLFLAQRLRAGELVAVPSETVYGLAADALSAKACRGIFRAKDRPAADPLIVHVASIAQAGSIAELSEPARKLMRKFWPGPLTLVLPKKPAVPDVVTSGQPSVAVRMPGHPLFLKLLALTGTPLAAPSANPFGYVSPTTAQHVQDGLGKRIRYILDGGPCEVGVESTILDLRDPLRPRLLRPGKITKRELEKVLGRRVERSVPARLPLNASQSVGGAGCPQHAQRLTAFGAGKRTMPSGLGATRWA
jgi:L-threonylcarbamoyladenylate synthase